MFGFISSLFQDLLGRRKRRKWGDAWLCYRGMAHFILGLVILTKILTKMRNYSVAKTHKLIIICVIKFSPFLQNSRLQL